MKCNYNIQTINETELKIKIQLLKITIQFELNSIFSIFIHTSYLHLSLKVIKLAVKCGIEKLTTK